MKGRIIGALYVLLFFGFGLFWDRGKFFVPIVLVWLLLALAELNLSDYVARIVSRERRSEYSDCIYASMAGVAFAICCCIVADDYRIVALAVISCFVSDTCGFVVGKLLGERNKVSALRNISPNKSVAGFVGAILVSAPLNYWVAVLLGMNFDYPALNLVLFACFSGVFAAGGDLLGSASKRALGVKDSGQDLAQIPVVGLLEKPLLSGHGGYYDRMDSICIEIGIAYVLLFNYASH